MAYGNWKDLTRTAASYKSLQKKAFNSAKNPKDDGDKIDPVAMIYK